jgi:hypothetical protein
LSGSVTTYVLKLTNSGGFAWADAFQPTNSSSASHGQSIVVDGNGNVYAAGTFRGSVNFNPAPKGAAYTMTSGSTLTDYVTKLNANGGFTWAKAFGANGGDLPSLALDSSGSVYVAGYFQGTASFGSTTLTSAGSADIYVVKFASSGSFQWAVSAGSTGSAQGTGIAVDGSGNVYVTGFFEGTVDFGLGASGGVLTASSNGSAFLWKLTQP